MRQQLQEMLEQEQKNLGILIPFSVFAILAYYTLFGSLHPLYLVSGVFDLIFAVLFSLFLYSSHQAKGNSHDNHSLSYQSNA